MVEHAEWCMPEYESGIRGQRVAIVGHSHHLCKCDYDRSSFTTEIVQKVIRGEENIQFFTRIASFFEDENARFWPRVLFFNFIPDCVGTTDKKYSGGTSEQIQGGQARVLRLLEKHRPDKLLVFTSKGWGEFPPTLEETGQQQLAPLSVELSCFTRGTYAVGGHTVQAFGLRHPERANGDRLRKAVQHIMASPISDRAPLA